MERAGDAIHSRTGRTTDRREYNNQPWCKRYNRMDLHGQPLCHSLTLCAHARTEQNRIWFDFRIHILRLRLKFDSAERKLSKPPSKTDFGKCSFGCSVDSPLPKRNGSKAILKPQCRRDLTAFCITYFKSSPSNGFKAAVTPPLGIGLMLNRLQ